VEFRVIELRVVGVLASPAPAAPEAWVVLGWWCNDEKEQEYETHVAKTETE